MPRPIISRPLVSKMIQFQPTWLLDLFLFQLPTEGGTNPLCYVGTSSPLAVDVNRNPHYLPVFSHSGMVYFFSSVIVKALSTFLAQPTSVDHLLQENGRSIFAIRSFFV